MNGVCIWRGRSVHFNRRQMLHRICLCKRAFADQHPSLNSQERMSWNSRSSSQTSPGRQGPSEEQPLPWHGRAYSEEEMLAAPEVHWEWAWAWQVQNEVIAQGSRRARVGAWSLPYLVGGGSRAWPSSPDSQSHPPTEDCSKAEAGRCV